MGKEEKRREENIREKRNIEKGKQGYRSKKDKAKIGKSKEGRDRAWKEGKGIK